MSENDDVITAGGMGASDETRKVVGGWKAMQESKRTGKPVAKQKVADEKTATITESANPYYKGKAAQHDDGIAAEDLTRHLKRASDKLLTETTVKKKMFKGNAELCMTKLSMLFNGPDGDVTSENAKFTPKIVNIKESGYGNYTIYWTE